MLLNRKRLHIFHQYDVSPANADEVAALAGDSTLATRMGCEDWAVHRSRDGKRVVRVEAWSGDWRAAMISEPDHAAAMATRTERHAYRWKATGGVVPTPVDDLAAGVIVIDIVPVPRLVLTPVTAFTISNGKKFNREPGCISTTVLKGVGVGRIATYARWRTEKDFANAFQATTGKPACNADDINAAAAKMTFGVIRPDYHIYDLVANSRTR